MGLVETDKATGPYPGLGVAEIVVEILHQALSDLLHTAGTCPQLAEGRAADSHVTQREMRQVIHGSAFLALSAVQQGRHDARSREPRNRAMAPAACRSGVL